MKSKQIDWNAVNLNEEEAETLSSVENGEWKSIGNIAKRQAELRKFFSDENTSGNDILINIPQQDFEAILQKSNKSGIPYKELIEKLIHNFASGQIVI